MPNFNNIDRAGRGSSGSTTDEEETERSSSSGSSSTTVGGGSGGPQVRRPEGDGGSGGGGSANGGDSTQGVDRGPQEQQDLEDRVREGMQGETAGDITAGETTEQIRERTPRANQSVSLGTTGTPGAAAPTGPAYESTDEIRERAPRASQSRALGTTGTPTAAAGPQSQAVVEARREAESDLERRATEELEAETGREADVTIETRQEGSEIIAEIEDVSFGDPVEGDVVEDPSSGPIADFVREWTGDPLGGFRADVLDRRQSREEFRQEAVDSVESGLNIDFSEILPGTPASRKREIDSAVGEQFQTAVTAATLVPRAGASVASRGVSAVEERTDVDVSAEVDTAVTGATILPRAAFGAGQTAARTDSIGREEVAGAAAAGVAFPEPATSAAGAAVLGGIAAAGTAGYVSELEVGRGQQDVSELEVDDPAVQSELGVPEGAPGEASSELQPGVQQPSELGIPREESADPTMIRTGQQVGLQRERTREVDIDDLPETISGTDPDSARRGVTGRQRIRDSPTGAPSEFYNPQDPVVEPVDESPYGREREFPTGESAVVGRGTGQELAQDAGQTEVQFEESLPAEQTYLTTDEVIVSGVLGDEDVDVGVRQGQRERVDQVSQQMPDLQGEQMQETGFELDFDTPLEFSRPGITGTPTVPRMEQPPRFGDPFAPGTGTPGRPPRRIRPPDIDFDTDEPDRRRRRLDLFEKEFDNPVTDPGDVLSGDAFDGVDS